MACTVWETYTHCSQKRWTDSQVPLGGWALARTSSQYPCVREALLCSFHWNLNAQTSGLCSLGWSEGHLPTVGGAELYWLDFDIWHINDYQMTSRSTETGIKKVFQCCWWRDALFYHWCLNIHRKDSNSRLLPQWWGIFFVWEYFSFNFNIL